jgi:hypothetical protein
MFNEFTHKLLKLGYNRSDYIDVSGSVQENYVNGDNKVRFDKNGFFVVTENGKSLFNGFIGDDAESLTQYIKLLNRKTTINNIIDGSNK